MCMPTTQTVECDVDLFGQRIPAPPRPIWTPPARTPDLSVQDALFGTFGETQPELFGDQR